jgi:Zn-dependent peptidase ImmA (M78 family)
MAAHEIGHFVLHRDPIGDRVEDNYLLRDARFPDRVERQANRFGVELLMPDRLIRRLIEEGIDTVEAMAHRLQVSKVAMAIRLGHPT